MPNEENKVLFGLSNVHVAFLKSDTEHDTPEKIPGAVELTIDAEGEQNIFYADNGPYYTVNANAGYTGELTMAKVPDKVLAKMLGWTVDENGALIEVSDGIPTSFALLFEVNGDKRKRRSVLFKVTANRPSEDWTTTEDSAEVTTYTLPITVTTFENEGKNLISAKLEDNGENTEQYNSFFTTVYKPSFSEAV